MIQSPTDLIITLLPDLNQSDLRKVQKRVKILLSLSTDKPSDEDYLLNGVRTHTKSIGLGNTIPYGLILKPNSYYGYLDKSERMRETLSQHLGDMTRTEEANLGIICARCLGDYIKSYSEYNTVSFESLLNNIHHVPDALEKAFPGYIAAGVLQIIIRRKFVDVIC